MAERIDISSLKKGDVVTFFYMSGHDVRPTTLVLNYWEGLLHALNLNYLSAGQIEYLKTILGPRLYAMYTIENPKEFYDNEIKTAGMSNAYRTYSPAKIVNMFKIGYKLETIEKDTGLDKQKDFEDQVNKMQKDNMTRQQITTKIEIPKLLPDQILTPVNTPSTLPGNIFGVDYK